MSQTAPTPITALGTPPSTSDPANFDVRADALFTQLPDTVDEINDTATITYNNAVDAYNNALAAEADAVAVAANAALAALYAGATLWVSGGTYAIGTRVTSPTNGLTYRKITATAGGVVDPASNATDWSIQQITAPVMIVTGTTQTAVAGYEYVLTHGSATTVTLPGSPVSGDKVIVKPANGLETNVVNPNGATIEGVSGNMTIDNAFAVVNLQYLNSSWRLV